MESDVYDEEYSMEDVDNAMSILDNSVSDGDGEEDSVDKRPRVSMEKILKYRVFRRLSNKHAVSEEYEENDPVDKNIIIGEVTKDGNSYLFAARVLIDNSRKDFVFDGNRTEMVSFLIVLGAKTYDKVGKAGEILDRVDESPSPVRIIISMDSLMTHGVKYAKQIVTK